ncbi:hypothetical protein D1BOALGB6SA_4537 [Olavius sp. associated proteobacterium Delta 1]|nr:hypothetical protein D1BOALGB6SA_4537 [Olavius sp. associated proteobacterium Delta 1]
MYLDRRASLFICRKPTINLYDQIGYPASAGPFNGKQKSNLSLRTLRLCGDNI